MRGSVNELEKGRVRGDGPSGARLGAWAERVNEAPCLRPRRAQQHSVMMRYGRSRTQPKICKRPPEAYLLALYVFNDTCSSIESCSKQEYAYSRTVLQEICRRRFRVASAWATRFRFASLSSPLPLPFSNSCAMR